MQTPNFDEAISRVNTHCLKWDSMQSYHGVSADDGIAMWVADMDFRSPASVQRAVEQYAAHGIYGYFGDDSAYTDSIAWWMKTRHNWQIEKDWIFTTHGLVNGTAMCVDAFSQPGDAVILMAPVYHAFARVIRAAEREVRECPLVEKNGRYEFDPDHWQTLLTGNEKVFVLCSPHNPGGRVWTVDELRAVAEFCKRNDLVLVSDEIHHDLVFAGAKHTVMAKAAPEHLDRIIVMSAASKTFNLAGTHVGNVIIADPDMRKRFDARMKGLGNSPNAFGMHVVPGAYCEEGAHWLDTLLPYLQENARLFDDAVNAIDGVQSMKLESTYLAWVNFSGRGLSDDVLAYTVRQKARIAINLGPSFGTGGEQYLRFNLATPRAVVEQATQRLRDVFA